MTWRRIQLKILFLITVVSATRPQISNHVDGYLLKATSGAIVTHKRDGYFASWQRVWISIVTKLRYLFKIVNSLFLPKGMQTISHCHPAHTQTVFDWAVSKRIEYCSWTILIGDSSSSAAGV